MAQAAIIDKCDFCDSEEGVNYFCTNCEEFLCSKCKVGHAKSKKTKNDRIIPLAQAREDGIVHKPTTVFCSQHSSTELTLFCLKCNQFVCTRCLVRKHKKHHVTLPDEIKESKIEELKNNIKTLKKKKAAFENAFDAESKVHIHFSKSFDQVKRDITDQKAKIIEELNLLCDEQLTELTVFQQNEDKRFSDACSKIKVQNQAVTMAIQTAESTITSCTISIIVQAIMDTTRTLQAIEEPDIPSTTVATYEQGDNSKSSILQVQGKISIKQTTRGSYQPGHRSQPFDSKARDKDVQNIKSQEHSTSDDNKKEPIKVVNNTSIDVSNVKVKSIVKVKGKGEICTIVPLQNKTAWIKAGSDSFLTLIDSRGKIITTSVSLDSEIYDAKQYRNGVLVICCGQCKIYYLSEDGKSTSTFSDLKPYKTCGLCVTRDMKVMVCLYLPGKDNKVVRLNISGHIIQTFQRDVTGASLYHDLYRVALLTTGEVIVRDGNKIVAVDRKGSRLFTWEGEIQERKLDKYSVQCITEDSNNNLFVTDNEYHKVFVLNGSGAMCLLDSTWEIYRPWGIAVDYKGQLWIGCYGGYIHIIEY